MKGLFLVLIAFILLPIIALFIGSDQIFIKIYEFFEFIYGQPLGLHLSGWNGANFAGNVLYVPLGVSMYYSTLILVVTFYYFINSVKFSRWYHWLIVLLVCTILNYAIGYYLTFLDYSNNDIAPDIAPSINLSDLYYFGMINAIFSIVLFILFSFSLRWWSTNCSTTPIPA